MLTKFEDDFPIETYADLQNALAKSTSAKNACSLRHGFSPEVLVFGKGIKVPGSVTSDDTPFQPTFLPMKKVDRDLGSELNWLCARVLERHSIQQTTVLRFAELLCEETDQTGAITNPESGSCFGDQMKIKRVG